MEKVELVFDPDNARAAGYVGERLSMFNASRTGRSDYYPCKIFLKGEKGETLGGLLGYLWSDWLFVSILWVDEALRGQGHATRLMDAAEDYAASAAVTRRISTPTPGRPARSTKSAATRSSPPSTTTRSGIRSSS